jgi:hypothetical protein
MQITLDVKEEEGGRKKAPEKEEKENQYANLFI